VSIIIIMAYKKLPLAKLLKGRLLRIGELQDLAMIELSQRFDFILHGGTAVWRVYQGNRFSYDIDIYCDKPEEIARHFTSLQGIGVVRKKLTPSGVLYMRLKDEGEIELEASPFHGNITPVEREYWLVDGGNILVKTLSPEDLVREKIRAYLSRGQVRDLYDIYYLLDFCETRIEGLKEVLALKTPPADFEGLKDLILIGRSPSFETILSKVRRYARA